MNMRNVMMIGSSAVAVTLALAAPALADTTEDLLSHLRSKGVLTASEFTTLSQRHQAETARAAADAKAKVDAQVQAQVQAAKAAAAGDDKTIVRKADKGLGLKVGDVNIQLSGSINGFYVHDTGDSGPNTTVAGGVVNTNGNSSSVRNGLLPGYLKVDVTTTQEGFDLGAHFGIYPGINSVSWNGGANSAGQPQALGTSGADFRQTYLTVGNKSLGELKVGRDIGLFGSDAILNDMTLLGVGTAAANSSPSNTSLGRIGLGYIYTDFQPQITYTTPTFAGFTASAGVFTPMVTAGSTEVNDSPGFQGKLTYDFTAGGATGHLWGGFITQKHDQTGAQAGYTGTGFDVGAKLGYGPVGLTGYYYTGEGIGTTGLFILSATASGSKRDSDGFYVQGTVKPIEKLTLGVSYGESNLDLASGEVNPTLVKQNSSWAFQTKYALTDWVSLVGEYTSTTSKAHGGNEASSDAIALGAILFF